jgi:hypothetical protein
MILIVILLRPVQACEKAPSEEMSYSSQLGLLFERCRPLESSSARLAN